MSKRMTPHARLVAKLKPGAVRVSPKFHAILGCLLDQEWSKPRLIELVLTTDGMLLGCAEGDCGCNEILGDRDNLYRNLDGVLTTVEATEAERRHLFALVALIER